MWMQNQLGWRVQDAVRAGVHPLAAIGSNLSPPTPATVIGDSGGSNMGVDLAEMGQGVSRALSAGMGQDAKYETTLRALQVERGELENAKLRFDLQQMHTQAGNPPGLVVSPSDQPIGYASGTRGHFSPANYPVQVTGLPPSPDAPVEMKSAEVVHNMAGNPGVDAGTNPDIRTYRDSYGNVYTNPSSQHKMDDLGALGAIQWAMRNRILPALPYAGQNPHMQVPRPGVRPPKGAIGWYYNPLTGRHSPAYPGEGAQYHPWFIPDHD